MSDQGRSYRAIAPRAVATPQLQPVQASEPIMVGPQWMSSVDSTPMASAQASLDEQFIFNGSMDGFGELPVLGGQGGGGVMAGQAVAGQNPFFQQDFTVATGDGTFQQNSTLDGVEQSAIPHPEAAMADSSINAFYFPPVDGLWQTPPLATCLPPSTNFQQEQIQITDEHELCKTCNEFYFKARNHELSCVRHRFHLPTPNLMDPLWMTWDENVNGPMETPRNRQAFAKAFLWPCCGRPSPAGGCTSNFHVAWEQPEKEEVQEPSWVEGVRGMVGLGVMAEGFIGSGVGL